MSETYLTVMQTAELLNIGERAVRKNALNGKYGEVIYMKGGRGGLNGKSVKINFSSLPVTAQTKYLEDNKAVLKKSGATKASAYDTAPEWQREIASRRHKVIIEYKAYLAKSFDVTERQAMEDFVEEWNENHLHESISRATLYRWYKNYTKRGIAGLLTNYGNCEKKRSISPEAWDAFCGKYLTLSRLSIDLCHELTTLEAKEYGWQMPSVKTLYRMVKEDIPEGVKQLLRYGNKAFYDNVQTFTRRDVKSIGAGEAFVGDHHVFDLFILNGKKWVRPWLTAWLDMRSRKLVGWNINLSPCTDTIIAAFAEAALNPAIGLPRDIYIDNGRDYCSYKFAGRGNRGKRLTDEEKAALLEEGKVTETLMQRLQINTHFAIVENARAKVIEREFKNVVEWFSKLLPTYCGRNQKERPEDNGKKLKQPEKYGITLEEFKKLFNDWAINVFNKTVSKSGKGREGESPDATFMRTRLPVRTADKEALRLFFMKSTNPFKIGRNGVTFKGVEYYAKNLILKKGQMVYIRYREEDLSCVWLYDTKDRYIGEAKKLESIAAINADQEVIQKDMQRKALERKAVTEHPTYSAAKTAKPLGIAEIVELYKKHNNSAPDVVPSKVVEVVNLSAGSDAVRAMKATGTCNINPFEVMKNVKFERRKGEF